MTSNIFKVLKDISQFLVAKRKIFIVVILTYALPFIIIKENEQKKTCMRGSSQALSINLPRPSKQSK